MLSNKQFDFIKNFPSEAKRWLSVFLSERPVSISLSQYLNNIETSDWTLLSDDLVKFLQQNAELLENYCLLKTDNEIVRLQKISLYFQQMLLSDLQWCQRFIEGMKALHEGEADMAIHVIRESALPITDALRNELDLPENNPVCEAILLSGLYFGDQEDPDTFLQEIEIAIAQQIGRKEHGDAEKEFKPGVFGRSEEKNQRETPEKIEETEPKEIEQEESEIEEESVEKEEQEKKEMEFEGAENEKETEQEKGDENQEIEEPAEKEDGEGEREEAEETEIEAREKEEESEESEEEADEADEEAEESNEEKEKNDKEIEKTEGVEAKETEEHKELKSEKSLGKLKALLKKFLLNSKESPAKEISVVEAESETEMFKKFKSDTHLDEKLIEDSVKKTAVLSSVPEVKIEVQPRMVPDKSESESRFESEPEPESDEDEEERF